MLFLAIIGGREGGEGEPENRPHSGGHHQFVDAVNAGLEKDRFWLGSYTWWNQSKTS